MTVLAQQGADIDPDSLARRINAAELTISSKIKLRNSRLSLPNRLNYRQVMASPPTPTFTTAHTIATPRLWAATSQEASAVLGGSAFTFLRAGGMKALGTTNPNYNFVTFSNVNYGTSGQGQICNSYQVSAMHYGQELEIVVKGGGGSILVKVNDQYISLTPTTVLADGNIYYYYVNFGSRDYRRIDVQLTPGAVFGGFYTGQIDTVTPAPVRGPRCIILGDSFAESATGATSQIQGFPDYFADAMGWDDVWKSGVGSTGYLAAPGGKITFRQRLSTDVFPFSPDVVIVAGGLNDTAFTLAQMQTEAALLFAALQAGLPNATIIVFSPFYKAGAGSITQVVMNAHDGIKAAASAAGLPFVDFLEMPLPLNYVPSTATLQSNSSTTISVDKAMPVGTTWKFPNGDRMQVKALSGTGPYTVTPDQAFNNPHSTGDVVTQVGDCFWSGNGKQGATTGYGNADEFVFTDGTHPTPAGHSALGQAAASLTVLALAPN